MRALRVATWNIASGHRSAQAPDTYNAADQRAALMNEVLRWHRAGRCDFLALQECELAVDGAELACESEAPQGVGRKAAVNRKVASSSLGWLTNARRQL